ncbi:Protein MOS2 [Camellia lanceoleosa]|uniref:Protein MOS2 n=1 Tax=Camellia lanceoleosa TaxID=1840588 RepID=A0ACC0HU98_9ERIC|nr:Protein MOS2 [Camellia lanceoleosa]
MKLSFSLSSKPSSKQQQQQQPKSKPLQKFNTDDDDNRDSANKEYLTEFDASKSQLASQNSKKLVIPPKPNEWRPHKKMKNLDLPLQSSSSTPQDLQFELESTATADADPNNMSYGLNLRNSNTDDANNSESDDVKPQPQPQPQPQRPIPIESVMLHKLKEDLKRLPDDRGIDEYADMPVEGFGAALLAGYGWYEGRGIGRNVKEDVKVVQYERRTAKEGLGFVTDMPVINNNNNTSSSNAMKKEKELRNISGGGEEQEGRFRVGKDVRIIGGRDIGLKGRIVEVMELGSVEEERCLRKLKELRIQGSKGEVSGSDGDGKRVKDSSSGRRSHRQNKEEEGIEEQRKDDKRSREEGRGRQPREELRTTNQVRWLSSHIRVRIISKDLKGGRLYLKKGEVVDVVGLTTCDISMDDTRELIQGVDQGLLETALPRRGGPVLVLYGKHKGVYGSLVEKDVENETAVVRDADTHVLLNVRLEQIAEYIGDPSYIGY